MGRIIVPLRSLKLASNGSAATCSTLLRTPVVVQVNRQPPLSGVTEIRRKAEFRFVGFVPARNSFQLFTPSPSESAPAAAAGLSGSPKYSICQSRKAERVTTSFTAPGVFVSNEAA